MKTFLSATVLSLLIISCQNTIQKSEKELNTEVSESIVLKNFEYMSAGDMESFQKTISDDFKFILSGTLKWNDGKPLSRTYEGFDSFINDFLTPALATMPNGLKFNFDKIIANDTGAAVIWNGESEALYDTYNNKYVYIYEVNEKGLVSSITGYTDLLLSASSLLGQKTNTNFKEK
jgi:ketosteroid isomerase-like protein|tara:strand:+ start:1823 stop:2350 length:528 start_codon:yes stop_codon:yes gene_type:complete